MFKYGFALPDETILENWTGFQFPLKIGLVASIDAEIDYHSQPAEGTEELSTSYRFRPGYKF